MKPQHVQVLIDLILVPLIMVTIYRGYLQYIWTVETGLHHEIIYENEVKPAKFTNSSMFERIKEMLG